MNAYAGIGSRETPDDVLELMFKLGAFLGSKLILRSGGANGADTAFEKGCDSVEGKKEIYLPWKRFNDNESEFISPTDDAYKIISELMPNFDKIKPSVQKLFARNVHQILGRFVNDPVQFVVCWSVIDKETNHCKGGTAVAIFIAQSFKIPVYNLYDASQKDLLKQRLLSKSYL